MSKRAKVDGEGDASAAASAPVSEDAAPRNLLGELLELGVPDAALAVITFLNAGEVVATCDAFEIYTDLELDFFDDELHGSELALSLFTARARRQLECKFCKLEPWNSINGADAEHLLKSSVRHAAENESELRECCECEENFCRRHAVKYCDRDGCDGGVGVCSVACYATVAAMQHDWPYMCNVCYSCARTEAADSS